MNEYRVLILGASGMLGHTLFKQMSKRTKLDVFGTVRSKQEIQEFFSEKELQKIESNIDILDFDTFTDVLQRLKPDVVINCIGIVKQHAMSNNTLSAITINSQFPHKLSLLAKDLEFRLIHISTDCVFNGEKGNYSETDCSDARDLYGRTKFLGELQYPHCLTIRTSIIGHELHTSLSLVDWFLGQENEINGFTKAIFSGLPTIEIAKIISDYIIPNSNLYGLYHVSGNAISKHDLLTIIKQVYKKEVQIKAQGDFKIDRSLNSDRFRAATGYSPQSWDLLIKDMFNQAKNESCYKNKLFK